MSVVWCVQTLLPRIVQLWEEVQVPLVHRSRFYLAFKGRETFYYEAEHRRLIHHHSQVCLGTNFYDPLSWVPWFCSMLIVLFMFKTIF